MIIQLLVEISMLNDDEFRHKRRFNNGRGGNELVSLLLDMKSHTRMLFAVIVLVDGG